MTVNPPFNLDHWVDRFRDQLKPPVGNKLLFEEDGMIAQIIGGPNTRVDFHDDPVQEFFYQIKGDMILKSSMRARSGMCVSTRAKCSCCRPTCAIRHSARWRAPTGWSWNHPAWRGCWTRSNGTVSSAWPASTA